MLTMVTEIGYITATSLLVVGLLYVANPMRARQGVQYILYAIMLAVLFALLNLGTQYLAIVMMAIGLGVTAVYLQRSLDGDRAERQSLARSGAITSAAVILLSMAGLNQPDPINLARLLSVISSLFATAACAGFTVIGFAPVPLLQKLSYELAFDGRLLLIGLTVTAGLAQQEFLFGLGLIALFCLSIALSQAAEAVDRDGFTAFVTVVSNCAISVSGASVGNPYVAVAGAIAAGGGMQLLAKDLLHSKQSFKVWLSNRFTVEKSLASSPNSPSSRFVRCEDVAILLAYAKKVIVVPGYGLAAANAQALLRDLLAVLEERRIDVCIATHPVGGRMPGHITQILLEVGVSPDKLRSIETINPLFSDADVALVIGANDIINPSARFDRDSSLFGLPVLNVDSARSCIVIKRGTGAGFSQVENGLFSKANCRIWHADAASALKELLRAIDQLG